MAFNTEYAQQIHRHVVIWLDDHIGEVGNNEAMKDRFRRVTYPLYTFIDTQSTVSFIQEQQNNGISVFLIVSGKRAHEILPIIYPLSCVVYVFIFCGDMQQHLELASIYINKVLMYDSDEDLLIALTNEIANHLLKEAETCEKQNDIARAAGLLDWADWLYQDALTLKYAACQRFLQIVRQQRQQLGQRHKTVHPNQINT